MIQIIDNSNQIIDDGAAFITPRDSDDYREYADQHELLARLDKLETPSQRLITLFKSVVNFQDIEPTHESNWVKLSFIAGGLGGFVLGGILKSPEIQSNYIRRHNAAIFEGKYVGNRHFWDSLILGCASKGLRYGLRCSLLVGSASLIAVGSCTFRNKLYYPDYLAGYGALGAISRLWLGPRAVLVGGLIGGVTGTFAYGLVRLFELGSGMSVTQIRLLNHRLYLSSQEDRHRKHLEYHNYYRSTIEGEK